MSLETFNWSPNAGWKTDGAPNVNSTKLGDGYEVRSPIGLNAVVDTYTVSFTGPWPTKTGQIDAFLRGKLGALPFLWRAPTDDPGVYHTYVCRKWSKTHIAGNVFQLDCAFERVFDTIS